MFGVFPIGSPQFGDAINYPSPTVKRYRQSVVVSCRVKECRNEIADLTLYNLQDALLYNTVGISILANCPVGYYCAPGVFPRVFNYPAGTFSVPLPPAGQAFSVVITATGCEWIITRVAPPYASATAISTLGQSVIKELAAQQGRCDAIKAAGSALP